MGNALLSPSWTERMRADQARAFRNQTPELRRLTAQVMERAVEMNAAAFVLTGSTARGRRTAISDLDYHMIGERPDLDDLRGDVDMVADSLPRFQRRIAEGDDFVHWSLRFGCVLYDPDGLLRDAHQRIVEQAFWPDPDPKFARAIELANLSEKVLSIGDREAGQEHVRAALTSAARGKLLARHVFPLARAELPRQLLDMDLPELAGWLEQTIYGEPSIGELGSALGVVRMAADGDSLRSVSPAPAR